MPIQYCVCALKQDCVCALNGVDSFQIVHLIKHYYILSTHFCNKTYSNNSIHMCILHWIYIGLEGQLHIYKAILHLKPTFKKIAMVNVNDLKAYMLEIFHQNSSSTTCTYLTHNKASMFSSSIQLNIKF